MQGRVKTLPYSYAIIDEMPGIRNLPYKYVLQRIFYGFLFQKISQNTWI